MALEAFWAVNASGGFDEAFALRTLEHPNPFVRYWTVRLIGDAKKISSTLQHKFVALARTEKDSQVRSQLASSCKRLPAADALPVMRELLLRTEDVDDTHIPLLLWWAIESKCAANRDLVLELFRTPSFWRTPIVSKFIVARLGQRFTAERSEANLVTAAELLALAPSERERDELVRGMEEGLQGDVVRSVPAVMQERVAALWAARPRTPTLMSFALRLGNAEAAAAALERVANPTTPLASRQQLLALLAERRVEAAVPVLLKLLREEAAEDLRIAVVNHLPRFNDNAISDALLGIYPGGSAPLRDAIRNALGSRANWSRQLLEAVARGAISREQIPVVNLLAMQNHHDARCDELIQKLWGNLRRSSEEKAERIAHVRKLLVAGRGDLASGRAIFKQACAACHTLFGDGGKIGPDLTGYERDNLDFLLPAIVDPSLAIREEFTAFNVTTKDDESLTGLLTENKPQSVTLVDAAGHATVIPREQIQSLQAARVSLMPEGLLDALEDQQVRDLLGYITQRQ